MYWKDGSIYKGEWVKGIQHGYGEMIYSDGTTKIGMFDNNSYVSHVKDNIFSQKNLLEQVSHSQERKLSPLKGHSGLRTPSKEFRMNQS
jgi:hypothetical protein